MKLYSLKQIYKYAEKLGFSADEIEIRKDCVEYDYEKNEEVAFEYEVFFGHEYTEVWSWTFENLEEKAIDFDHIVWED